MPGIEVNASSSICRKCGTAYSRLKGYFPVSYSYLYKGTGYLPYCRECVDNMYTGYLNECKDPKKAVRQMCRKLDLYWSDKVFETVEKQNSPRSMMTSYITKINAVKLASKSYDDTLKEEGVLWEEPRSYSTTPTVAMQEEIEIDEVSDDVVAFWGPGYTPSMYTELENRYKYWMARFPNKEDVDIGTEALVRQICNLEIDINRDRAAGKSIDKNVNTLNNLLGSAMLKPAQQRDETESSINETPLGVWIDRWEKKRPIPEPDSALKDVDKIVKYITVWFYGHISKTLGIKNMYCDMYEKEMEKMKVSRPEAYSVEDDDDETVFNSIFGGTDK